MKFAALSRISVLLTLAGMQSAVYTADYPSKPIRMIVGFAAGGGTDTTARAIAQKMSAAMGEQVVVDNRPGAAGNVATELVVRGPADGYTILMGTIAALAINPTLYGNLAIRPYQGSGAGFAGSEFKQHPRRTSERAGEISAGVDRARKSQARHAELWLIRDRRHGTSCRRSLR